MTLPLQWVPGNQAIPLDAATPPKTVVSGSLAVFAVDRESGERLHLFGLEPGDPLLPLAPPPHSPAEAAWELAAIPLEATALQDTGPEQEWQRIFTLENWLEKLGSALGRFRPAPGVLFIEDARSLELKPGQKIAVEQGLQFVYLHSGKGSLLGTPVAEGSTVALTPGLWLEPLAEAVWKPADAGGSDVLTATLDLVGRILFEALDEFRLARYAADREIFAARQALNRLVSEQALRDLAGIAGVPGSHAETRAETRAGGDPLLEAVRAAAAFFQLPVHAPHAVGRRSDAVREIAQASGLRTRTVILGGDWWKRESGPLVTHRENGNPVALVPRRNGYEIFDPAANIRVRAGRATAASLNTFAQMLYQPLPEDLSPRGLLTHALRSRRADLGTIAIAGICAAILGLAAPQGFATLIGQAIPDADTGMVWQVGAGVVAAAFGSAIFLLAQAVAILRAQSATFVTLQTGVWDYLLRQSPSFFRGFSAGQLRLRADAVTRIHQLLTADALRSLLAGAASFLSLLLILWYSPAIAAIALCCGLLAVAHIALCVRSQFRVEQARQEREELLSGLVLQAINAVSKLRVAGAADRAFSVWAHQYSLSQKLSLAAQTIRDRMRLFHLVLPALGSSLAFFWLLRQPVALGPFLACSAALTAFLTAIASAGDSIASLVLVASKWKQVESILAVKPEVDASRIHPGRLRGAVSVENLTFRYRDQGPMILDGVSIAAAPGQCIALTGPSGSGKSTLLNLILRFETPQSGAIYLDGRELSGLDITAVRRQIGVVTQDGRIMAGSIFENICCGGVNTMDDAWEAARSAGLAEDIEAMPMGMHTVVSEGGGNLSGGQRQRVLIARALLLKPSILIFDEATSALDNRTQAVVTASLNRLKATRILVAHRLSTIRNADRIYVIDKGKVVEEGTFTELSARPGLFSRLVSRQHA